ncbi:MAG TPA: class I SAM-dependent methyltransferase [Albitalea sp.]
MHAYTAGFYAQVDAGSQSSARVVLPIVLDLLPVESAIDVGCGLGAWPAALVEHGIADVCGVDGPYVDVARLLIPRERFVAADLERPLAMPRRFDLVMSMEVAEHLPPSAADTFVASLVSLGPAVLFSAAIPGQGGERHVNEQWPGYWSDKFAAHGYVQLDCIRDRVWDDARVEPWYAQNTFLYASRALFDASPRLQAEAARGSFGSRALVHPRQWTAQAWKAKNLAAIECLFEAVPPGSTLVLVDEGCLSARSLKPWVVRRVFERDGVYWGAPESGEAAVAELERLRAAGADVLVVAWGASWWFDAYPLFRDHVRATLRTAMENEVLSVFDLRSAPPAAP